MEKTKGKQSSKCTKCTELEIQMHKLTEKLNELHAEKVKYEILLEQYGLGGDEHSISDTELICVEQIRKLKEASKDTIFNQEDSKVLDILHRNLKLARGEKIKQDGKMHTKKLSDADLLKLIKN